MKKKTVIIIPIFILLIFIYLLFSVTFSLVGDNNIKIEYQSNYEDEGYIAKNKLFNLDKYVTVTDNIDSNNPGTYQITYELKFLLIHKTLTRNIKVLDDISIKLNGKELIYVPINGNYIDEGSILFNNKIQSTINVSPKVSNNINYQLEGEYEIKYVYEYNEETYERIRKIIVYNIPYTLSSNQFTKDSITISIDLNKFNNYDHIELPDHTTSRDKNINYVVKKNDTYEFKIYDQSNSTIPLSIVIDKIIGDITCKGIINMYGTTLSVNNDLKDVKEYEWILDGNKVKGSKEYKLAYKSVKSAALKVTFNDNSDFQFNCPIEDKLIYHFKYSETKKPNMKCNEFTASDKIRYDDELKRSINEAGFGTRAGVVAAARYLVGAFDSGVPYLGPKKGNSALGRYNAVGLNIGKQGAWGCNVDGWTQGMDCTNFISWVFKQNNLSINSYSTKNVYKTLDVIDRIRVGEIMLTPRTSPSDNPYKNQNFTHVGIVIGVTNDYLYIAESTTGNINQIVTSKFSKKNWPSQTKFTRVRFENYSKDGNLTDMWVQ